MFVGSIIRNATKINMFEVKQQTKTNDYTGHIIYINKPRDTVLFMIW